VLVLSSSTAAASAALFGRTFLGGLLEFSFWAESCFARTPLPAGVALLLAGCSGFDAGFSFAAEAASAATDDASDDDIADLPMICT